MLNVDYNESAYRKKFQSFQRIFNANKQIFTNDTNILNDISEQKRELEIERKKLQSEKVEYNKWQREFARDELIIEKISEAIDKLEPLNIPDYIDNVEGDKEYLLNLADCHFGIEFNIKDLFGKTINSYSPEIYEDRMWQLLNELLKIIDQNQINVLNIFELGDAVQGVLRLNSQLMQLKYGIIDSAIKYAEFLANWIAELSNFVYIKFQMVYDSNHNQLRICNAPKNAFPDENMSKVIMEFLKLRLRDNPNVEFIENPTGMNFANLCGYNVLGIHGEVKNLKKSIDDFERSYGNRIDYLVMGHCHHAHMKEVGINSEVLTVRSIVGVDPYGMSLNKTSNAGASLFVFEVGKGKTVEYSIKLR